MRFYFFTIKNNLVHPSLKRLAAAMGYSKEIFEDGLCFGFSMLYISACLLNEERRFIDRIEMIRSTPTQILLRAINAARIKSIAARRTGSVGVADSLTDSDLQLLEILYMYDALSLYQTPEFFSKETIFGHVVLHQNAVESIAKIAQSKAIADQRGLVSVYSQSLYFSNIFDSEGRSELSAYFERMEDIIHRIRPRIRERLCFILSSVIHAISMIYDPNSRRWTVMDINQWYGMTGIYGCCSVDVWSAGPYTTENPANLVRFILRSPVAKFNNRGMSFLTVRLYSTNSQLNPQLKEAFVRFRQENLISETNRYKLSLGELYFMQAHDKDGFLQYMRALPNAQQFNSVALILRQCLRIHNEPLIISFIEAIKELKGGMELLGLDPRDSAGCVTPVMLDGRLGDTSVTPDLKPITFYQSRMLPLLAAREEATCPPCDIKPPNHRAEAPPVRYRPPQALEENSRRSLSLG